jgi:chromosome partitioning protein
MEDKRRFTRKILGRPRIEGRAGRDIDSTGRTAGLLECALAFRKQHFGECVIDVLDGHPAVFVDRASRSGQWILPNVRRTYGIIPPAAKGKNMSMVLAVTGGRMESGKTTTAVNLAAAFAGTGKRALAVDLDPLTGLGPAVGVVPREERSVGSALVERLAGSRPDVLKMVHHRSELLAGCGSGGRLDVFAGAPRSAHRAERAIALRDYPGTLALREVLEDLAGDYDVVVMDTPPAVSALSAAGWAAADAVVAVSELSAAALPGTAVLKAGVEATWTRTQGRGHPRFLGTVLNKVPPAGAGEEGDAVERRFRQAGLRTFRTRIWQDALVSAALELGVPVCASHPDEPSGLAYRELMGEIVIRLGLTCL